MQSEGLLRWPVSAGRGVGGAVVVVAPKVAKVVVVEGVVVGAVVVVLVGLVPTKVALYQRLSRLSR